MVKKLIRLSKSSISKSEKLRVMDVLDKEYLGMGSEVFEFEDLLTKQLGRPVVCTSSGTAALHLALQACEVKRGDEVLVPSLTYLASYQAISATGAVPVSCDILENNLMIDISDAKKRVTKRTKAIMPVFYSGGVGDVTLLYDFAKSLKIRVIEDAAHAFGTTFESKKIGSFGDISCFSFDGIKNITSGEGGAVVTENIETINRIKDLRLLGVINDSNKRKINSRSWDFDVLEQGWRYHMSNLMAAIGIEQLKRFRTMSKVRQNLAKRYESNLKDSLRVRLIERNYDEVVPHIFPIIIDNLSDRDKLRSDLLKQNIETGIHWKPNHLLTKYSDKSKDPLPITEKIFPYMLTLPLHADLTEEEVDYVCETFIETLKKNDL